MTAISPQIPAHTQSQSNTNMASNSVMPNMPNMANIRAGINSSMTTPVMPNINVQQPQATSNTANLSNLTAPGSTTAAPNQSGKFRVT